MQELAYKGDSTMTITAINGSPKGASSNSREVISILQSMLPAETKWNIVTSIKEGKRDPGTHSVDPALTAADVLVIAFPLYVDGLPASLMEYLQSYAESHRTVPPNERKQRVFAIANCGFYEGEQNRTALEIVGHFCTSAGLDWCGGAGIGTGEMILGIKNIPAEAGIRKPVFRAIRRVVDAISEENGRLAEPVFAHHGFPWILYKLAGEAGWRSQIKKNGLFRNEIHARPLKENIIYLSRLPEIK